MANTKLMNMCMIMDKDHQRVIVQDKINGNWTGITFPGGKVEKGEGIIESTIREVKEETGLEVKDLQFSGLVHWYNDQTHERWLIFLFKTENYSGELLNETHEGKVFWVDLVELHSMNLASGFEDYLKLYLSDNLLEAYGVWNDGGWGEFELL